MFEGTFAGTKNGTVRFFQVKPAFPVEFPLKMGPPTSSHNELIPTFHPQAIHWYMHPWKLLYTRFAPGSTLYCNRVITYNAMYFVWGITTCNRSCIITTQPLSCSNILPISIDPAKQGWWKWRKTTFLKKISMCGYCQGQSVGILVDGCLKTSHGHMVQPTQHMFLSPSPLRPFAPSPLRPFRPFAPSPLRPTSSWCVERESPCAKPPEVPLLKFWDENWEKHAGITNNIGIW